MKFDFKSNVMYVKGVGPAKAKKLEKLNIFTMYDLLTHYPRTYDDQRVVTPIADVKADQHVVLIGNICDIDSFDSGRLNVLKATLYDATGEITLTWFNQSYLENKLHEGMRLVVIGKTKWDDYNDEPAMSQITSFSILDHNESPKLGLMPVYPSTSNLPQYFFRNAIQNLLDKMPRLTEILPPVIIREQRLMALDTAMREIHFPQSIENMAAARRRLAFDELFLIQCGLMLIKRQAKDERLGIIHAKNGKLVESVFNSFPFKLTDDQVRTFEAIASDMEAKVPMRRLVQGDVGSGKTVVAMLALVKAVEGGWQGALMAPTEILASQHYETFTKQLEQFDIRVGLLSAKVTRLKKNREEVYRKIAAHEFDIVIGTHALLQEGVQFAKLGLVVTDEQHRFGVAQRSELGKKAEMMPDILVMTATPIPRTMTLTIYGDLDVSLIKQMPPGRKPIQTKVDSVRNRHRIYEFVRKEILSGRQAYVVCPLIERSESERLSYIDPVEEMYELLSNGIFSDIPCAMIHGKIKPKEKDAIMERFRLGEVRLLVSTTVIEVGVDVPNATVMVVEYAERFGLSQLHQLRGRVGRGAEKSYCILISDSKASAAQARLDLMESNSDGFKLAEEDLQLRGPGQFFGEAQHGLPDLKIANVFRDVETLYAARDAAEKFITDDADLKYFAELRNNLALTYGDKFRQINDA